MSAAVSLHPDDDVVVALRDLKDGETIGQPDADGGWTVKVVGEVPRGHKLAIRPIPAGRHVRKFGYSIGLAQSDIPAGGWVHTHNVRTGLGALLDYRYEPIAQDDPASARGASFLGYERENGDVGIRNELWIINTVGCINKTCELLASTGTQRFAGRGIDGVFHFAHPFGCSQLGDDLTYTRRLLAALADHGNAAGVLIVGLGCENNQIDGMKELLGEQGGRIRYLRAQDEEDELAAGMRLLEELVEFAERFERKPVPLAKLKLGLKCGGSDGFSGLTANPLVGRLADIVTAEGGTALLTEVPEMFGAETILMNRAADEAVFDKIVDLVNDFKHYFIRHDQEIYENPSPGNKAGGITTLEEKSLGCTQKGGTARVTDVLPYGVRAAKQGLNLIQGPGNDLVSVTALAAAGAHIVLFTTGRGTPFGGPVPTVKLSTNSELAMKKRNWIDFDAGRLLGGSTMQALTEELFEYVLGLASGEIRTNGERNGYKEIAIFKDGVIL
ncbi:UxaA family hydrolase [Paenibacillus glycinis]|uniref:Altronate dehydratase n=1 Tax=Paenibacillus glycinis TaxID=2697035 RepID=A0ABW9XXG1_9BACL|nr:altronate dehydratase family protein [Paenibacillus glycinis]NBD27413.1 altronate dehydratase [Paenibacillus glycinis]